MTNLYIFNFNQLSTILGWGLFHITLAFQIKYVFNLSMCFSSFVSKCLWNIEEHQAFL